MNRHYKNKIPKGFEIDIIKSDRGPSCINTDDLGTGNKEVNVRFREKEDITLHDENFSEMKNFAENPLGHLSPRSSKSSRFDGLPRKRGFEKESSTSLMAPPPKRLRPSEFLKVGKLISEVDVKLEATVDLMQFVIADKLTWKPPVRFPCTMDKDRFAFGGMRNVHHASIDNPKLKGKQLVFKLYKPDAVNQIKKFKETEEQTRKCVQMHMLAKNILDNYSNDA